MKNTTRTDQSMNIDIQTPIRPIFNTSTNKKLNNIRQTHIEMMDTIIGYFTSPAARRALGKTKDAGHMVMAAKL